VNADSLSRLADLVRRVVAGRKHPCDVPASLPIALAAATGAWPRDLYGSALNRRVAAIISDGRAVLWCASAMVRSLSARCPTRLGDSPSPRCARGLSPATLRTRHLWLLLRSLAWMVRRYLRKYYATCVGTSDPTQRVGPTPT
jgi:hypothetical protein